MNITDIEKRFKEVTGLSNADLTLCHIPKGDGLQQRTSKTEYKLYGYVTTPLWLVDEMLEPQMASLTFDSKTCDACSGCGQFTVRLARKLYEKYVAMGVPPAKANGVVVNYWLRNNHYFTECQFSNVAKLVYIFGSDINVYVGDSLNMKYSGENETGLLFFNPKEKKWVNLPNLVQYIEPMKDDLDALLLVFDSLENKIANCK